MSKSYLVDVRELTPDEKADVYQYLDGIAFTVSGIFISATVSGFDGYYVSCTKDYFVDFEKLPYDCKYKDVTTWDLSDINYAFRAAFDVYRILSSRL